MLLAVTFLYGYAHLPNINCMQWLHYWSVCHCFIVWFDIFNISFFGVVDIFGTELKQRNINHHSLVDHYEGRLHAERLFFLNGPILKQWQSFSSWARLMIRFGSDTGSPISSSPCFSAAKEFDKEFGPKRMSNTKYNLSAAVLLSFRNHFIATLEEWMVK